MGGGSGSAAPQEPCPLLELKVIGHEGAQGVERPPVAGSICEVHTYPTDELQAHFSGAVEGNVEGFGEEATGFFGIGLAPGPDPCDRRR